MSAAVLVRRCRPVAVVYPQRRQLQDPIRRVAAHNESSILPSVNYLEGSSTVDTGRQHENSRSTDDDGGEVCHVDCKLSDSDRVHVTDHVANLPYYHGRISSSDAKRRLIEEPAGTFLLRDSVSRKTNFPFAISVAVTTMTSEGRNGVRVTSVRVAKCQHTGQYYLDCADHDVSSMPLFNCVQSLVDYFVTSSSLSANGDASVQRRERGRCVLLDRCGRFEQSLTLRVPLTDVAKQHSSSAS